MPPRKFIFMNLPIYVHRIVIFFADRKSMYSWDWQKLRPKNKYVTSYMEMYSTVQYIHTIYT